MVVANQVPVKANSGAKISIREKVEQISLAATSAVV